MTYDFAVPLSPHAVRLTLKEMANDEDYRFHGEVIENSFRLWWYRRPQLMFWYADLCFTGTFSENECGTHLHFQVGLCKIRKWAMLLLVLALTVVLITVCFLNPLMIESDVAFVVLAWILLCFGCLYAEYCLLRKKAVTAFVRYFEVQINEGL